jgi:hypothetical protein
MEIIEIISHYIDKTKNLISVEFMVLGDDDDMVREDLIEYSYFEEFGFDTDNNFDIFESMMGDDYDEWEDEEYDYMDEDKLITFLNEYYVVYSDKLPKPQFK